MTNVRTPTFESEPALTIREDGRELKKLMRDVMGKPRRQKPTPGTPEHRRALALKLVSMREKASE